MELKRFLKPNALKATIFAILLIVWYVDGVLSWSFSADPNTKPASYDALHGLLEPVAWETATLFVILYFLLLPVAAVTGLLAGTTLPTEQVNLFFSVASVAYFYLLSCAMVAAYEKTRSDNR